MSLTSSSSSSGGSSGGGGGAGGGGGGGGGGISCGGGVGGGGTRMFSMAVLTLALTLLTMSAPATAAAAVPSRAGPPDAAAGSYGAAAAVGLQKRNLQMLDCSQRCESFEIKVLKAYWHRNHPDRDFIDFLRDLVVYTYTYPELRDLKPLVEKAVQKFELCRYVTCSTDYMG